jgi:hypothetical protein
MLHGLAEEPRELEEFEGGHVPATALDLGDRRAGDSQMFGHQRLGYYQALSSYP